MTAMRSVSVSVFLAIAKAQNCQVADDARMDCGNRYTNEQSCKASGCCWSPTRPGKPWCFKAADECSVANGLRSECGHRGTQQADCEASGCCWKPGSHGEPWCFHKTSPPAPPAPPAPPLPPGQYYTCASPYTLPAVTSMPNKGLCMDDTTFSSCSDKVPAMWPNTNEAVTSLRLFKAWHPKWGGDSERIAAWDRLADWVVHNNAKVLMGTEVTCDGPTDDMMWGWSLELMKKLGPDHIMGVAVGNEMDIYWRQCSGQSLWDLWNWRYWKVLQSRVDDMDKNGFNNAKITIVWAMSVLAGSPWKEDGQAKVKTLVNNAYQKWGDRWVWSFNVYSIWDSNMWPSNGGNCWAKSAASVAIDYTKNMVQTARQRIKATTGKDDNPIWLGENGWSSPMPAGHPKFPYCSEYDSMHAFKTAYESFMSWDFSLPDGSKGPQHAFYFTMRDSYNVNAKESFGLVATCSDANCKIQSAQVSEPSLARQNSTGEIVV